MWHSHPYDRYHRTSVLCWTRYRNIFFVLWHRKTHSTDQRYLRAWRSSEWSDNITFNYMSCRHRDNRVDTLKRSVCGASSCLWMWPVRAICLHLVVGGQRLVILWINTFRICSKLYTFAGQTDPPTVKLVLCLLIR